MRKIFAEAEKAVCTPELYAKVISDVKASRQLPYEVPAEFALLVNRTVDREILIEVLSKALGCK